MKHNSSEAPRTNWQEVITDPADTSKIESRKKHEITNRAHLDALVQTAGEILFGHGKIISPRADEIYSKADQISYKDADVSFHEALLQCVAEGFVDKRTDSEALRVFELTAIVDEMRQHENPNVRDVIGLQKTIEFQREHDKVFGAEPNSETILQLQESFLNSYAEYDSQCADSKIEPVSFMDYLANNRRVCAKQKTRQAFFHRKVDKKLNDVIDACDQAIAALNNIHQQYDTVEKQLVSNC